MTVKKWSEARWESRLKSIQAIRYQMPEILNAFEEISNTSSDSLIRSECKFLENEIGSYEFILSIIIWYDILVEVNTISKSLQRPNMDLDISASMLSGLLSFLKNYRNTGFKSAKTTAKDLAEISEEITAFQALTVLKKCYGSFPNISIALRIILSIPVTSAGAERSFSKLKIIKNYLKSTLSQSKPTSLATLSIEQEICDSLDFNELIEIFAVAKARKKQF
ncbi:uncharacterized protein LOC112592126 [Melanaphis sacchari]|uniref:uncharacterized protein LOC112592126 n=1 Tax=Melanaphis sacchari TaxID=742174 RepID=UPI000DC14157|nr:uncharacterized protein LOC112592126 [Melanaphis sacchari]